MSSIIDDIKKNKPYKRISFLAMLLGFHPNYYTKDFEDEEIIYGEKKDALRYALTYLQCKKSLQANGLTDFSKLDNLYSLQKWDELFAELNRYMYKDGVIDSGCWRYFRSYNFEKNSKNFHSEEVNHRLYLTIGLEYRDFFAQTFMEYCNAYNLPYYFKVLTIKGQTDTFVIYIDNEENLKATIDIINTIYKDMPKLKNVTKEPAPHLYRVNDHIGYGFEPKLNGKKMSYTQLIKTSAGLLDPKIINLKKRILSDFKMGRIYSINNPKIIVPTKNEVCNFISYDKKNKFIFFKKYFSYILSVYGNDIVEIMSEIEENVNNGYINNSNIVKNM